MLFLIHTMVAELRCSFSWRNHWSCAWWATALPLIDWLSDFVDLINQQICLDHWALFVSSRPILCQFGPAAFCFGSFVLFVGLVSRRTCVLWWVFKVPYLIFTLVSNVSHVCCHWVCVCVCTVPPTSCCLHHLSVWRCLKLFTASCSDLVVNTPCFPCLVFCALCLQPCHPAIQWICVYVDCLSSCLGCMCRVLSLLSGMLHGLCSCVLIPAVCLSGLLMLTCWWLWGSEAALIV